MIAPEYHALVPALEEAGLVNEDAPGMEAIENAMAPIEPPAGDLVVRVGGPPVGFPPGRAAATATR